MDVIEVNDLHRRYGGPDKQGFDAVRGVSFSVRPGELFALLGTNGAGKTSALEVVEGLTRPTSSGRLSRDTARNYLSSAAAKLGAANRHEAVHVARTHGWI